MGLSHGGPPHEPENPALVGLDVSGYAELGGGEIEFLLHHGSSIAEMRLAFNAALRLTTKRAKRAVHNDDCAANGCALARRPMAALVNMEFSQIFLVTAFATLNLFHA